jgi:hypothetical protein
MTYKDIIQKEILNGTRISHRYCEVELEMNHPPIAEAVKELQDMGFKVREVNGHNLSTGKDFKQWVLITE